MATAEPKAPEPTAPEPAVARLRTLPPIPLRTLVTLINYQCSVNCGRYSARSLQDREAPSRAPLRRNTFHHDLSLPESPYSPATCSVHPNGKAGADDLSSAELERIFYQSRWQNRSIIFAQVFQQFLLRCAKNQEVIVQIRNEKPKLVKARDVMLSHVHVSDLRQEDIENKVQRIPGSDTYDSYFTEDGEKSPKTVLLFPPPYTSVGPVGTPYNDDIFVVGMAHIEYGEMGLLEEPYFIGNGRQWQRCTTTKVCKKVFESSREILDTSNITDANSVGEIREFADEILGRWINRGPSFPVVRLCGRGGGNFIGCVECEKGGEIIRYCGVVHQDKAREVHKFTCEGSKTRGLWTAGQCCEYCGAGGRLITCTKCEKRGKFVKYCSAKHRKKDWKLHQLTCELRLWDSVKRRGRSLIPRIAH
ncbi:721b6fc3-89df-43cc-9a09-7693a17f3b68-CDS [Sclerotinia trifoliorum]|uniref:721b6fc3-89df-43cc-9a09-7693a17f3b68-CDS n=1 Tax=Sclerotinia trifoliorum TaxID=28548 RepID=A0A8H2VUH3_9HELO|nr:721b6fc3-89df-43cc-9a09-7693a17f3b68-CDS [Sclerotinia trifoliorum]